MNATTIPISSTHRREFLAFACLAGLATVGCSDRTPAAPPTDPPASAEQDQHLSQLEGVWAGTDNKTPFGPMPFGLAFDRQTDGSLHARTTNASGLYVDLRLAKDAMGRWLMTEEAAIPGRGKQTHTLAAATLGADTLTFRDVDHPDDLQVSIQLADKAMVFQVMWKGQEHVLFHLGRLEGAAAERARQALGGAPVP